jgi:hypothetical protein
MEIPLLKAVLTILFTLVAFVQGFILRKKGQPYQKSLVTSHKLVSLLAGGAFLWYIWPAIQLSLIANIQWILISMAFFFVISLASGAKLTTTKAPGSMMLWVHRISPMVTLALGIISAAVI